MPEMWNMVCYENASDALEDANLNPSRGGEIGGQLLSNCIIMYMICEGEDRRRIGDDRRETVQFNAQVEWK